MAALWTTAHIHPPYSAHHQQQIPTYAYGPPTYQYADLFRQQRSPGLDTQPWQHPPDPPDWQRHPQPSPYGSHDFGTTDLVAHGHAVTATFGAEQYTAPMTIASPYASLTDHQPAQSGYQQSCPPPYAAANPWPPYQPDPLYQPPPARRRTCWDPPVRDTPGQHPYHDYSAYDQPPGSSWAPPFQTSDSAAPQRYQNVGYTDRIPMMINANGVDRTEPLGMPRDPVTPDLEPNIQVAALVSQLESLTATVGELVSRMDASEHRPLPHAESRPSPLKPALQTAPPSLEQQPAAVSDWHPSSLCSATTISPPCSPEFRVEGALLDDEEKDGFLTASSPSPMCMNIQELCFRARSEALECIPTGPDDWGTFYIYDVKAIMIYCPRRLRMLGILGVHRVDAGTINALAKHRQIWTDIGSIDCGKMGETSLGNIAFPLTSWLSATIVFIDCRKYCVFDPGGLADEGAIMGIDDEIFRLCGMELIDGMVLVSQRAICASIKDICLENGSIEKVKKVAASFTDVRVSSYDVVEDGCVKQGCVYLCAFLGDKVAYGLSQELTKIAFLYVDLYVSDVDSINHRSTSFDTDARLIPPRTDMLCLNIFGRVDELPILALHCSDPKSPPLVIFEGNNEERCLTILCAFDPGGDISPKPLLLTLFVVSWFPP